MLLGKAANSERFSQRLVGKAVSDKLKSSTISRKLFLIETVESFTLVLISVLLLIQLEKMVSKFNRGI
jgi:hypothetical protein